MILDQTAAAYGLFQVAFTEVTDLIAATLFGIRQRQNASLQYADVFCKGFSWQLDQLEAELTKCEGDDSLDDERNALKATVLKAKSLADWRNKRIHARVQRDQTGLALFDWRTRQRLSMSYDEFIEKIDDAMCIVGALNCNGPKLGVHLDTHEILERAFAEVELAWRDWVRESE